MPSARHTVIFPALYMNYKISARAAALSPSLTETPTEELPAKLASLQTDLEEKAKAFREGAEFQAASRQQHRWRSVRSVIA